MKMTQEDLNRLHCKTIWHIRHTVFRMRKRGFADWQINGWVPTMAKRMVKYHVYKNKSWHRPITELSLILRDCKDSGLLDGLEALSWDGRGKMECQDVNVRWTEFCDERFGKYGEKVKKDRHTTRDWQRTRFGLEYIVERCDRTLDFQEALEIDNRESAKWFSSLLQDDQKSQEAEGEARTELCACEVNKEEDENGDIPSCLLESIGL